MQQRSLARTAGTLDADDASTGLAKPAQQRGQLVLATNQALVFGGGPVRWDWPIDNLAPQVLAEGGDRRAAVAVEGGFVRGQVLPTPLGHDVLVQRDVEFFVVV